MHPINPTFIELPDLRTHNAHAFRHRIETALVKQANGPVVLDLAHTASISAACLGVLAEFADRVQVHNVPPQIQCVLEVTGLNQVLKPAA